LKENDVEVLKLDSRHGGKAPALEGISCAPQLERQKRNEVFAAAVSAKLFWYPTRSSISLASAHFSAASGA